MSDTDPSELTFDDVTPAESPVGMHTLNGKMDRMLKLGSDIATGQIELTSKVDTLKTVVDSVVKRVTALELSQRWAPFTFSAIALVVALWAAFQVRR